MFLSTRRASDGQGYPCYVEVAEIVAYCEIMAEFNLSSRKIFLKVVGALDTVFVPFQRNKIQKERELAKRRAEQRGSRRGGA